MFLATSADQRYWDKSQEILFLHEGCKLYSQKKDWEILNYSVLPYPWSNSKNFSKDVLFIEKLTKQILQVLSRELNTIHNIQRSEKYWKIILYPWLFIQIYLLYDRYLQIQSAKTSNLVTDTYVLQCDDLLKIIPFDPFPFMNWTQLYDSDEYNQYIYGRIIEITNALPHTVVDYQPNLPGLKRQKWFSVDTSNKNLLKKICITINDKLAALISMNYNQIQIIQSFMPYTDTIRLYIKLKQFPSIIENIPIEIYDNKCSLELRNRIKDKLLHSFSNNEFERLFSTLFPELLPKVYLENFKQISDHIQKYAKKTKIVYAACGIYDPEILIYAAEICDQNKGKFITTQHGGDFGSALYTVHEIIQKEISDIFLSWGWDDKLYKNVIAMSTASKFNYVKEIATCRNFFGKILLIETDTPRCTCGSGILSAFSYPNYIDEQFVFYKHLSKGVRSLLNIRLLPCDRWDFQMQWAEKFPDADTDSKGKSFYELLKDCRLAINTVNETTYLECLVANIPTIVFFNPKYDLIRPEAQPYFDMLHKVGILHYTPESAAKLVNEIYEDPMKWWMQPEIQEAKDTFCYHFARTSDDALDQLAKFLKKEYDRISN